MALEALDYESLNENGKKVYYAVRGELYLRASEFQKEEKKVVALCQASFLLDDPNVGLMFSADAIAKAKHYLSLTSGGLGMYVRIFLLFGTVEDRSINSSLRYLPFAE
ncbi:Glutamate--glyoxylate aminotransferase 1 [Linum perenne]